MTGAGTATLAEVRRVLAGALGDDRLASVDPDVPLLASGLVSSIEVVAAVVALEARFDRRIPMDGVASLTLASLVALAGGEAPAAIPEAPPSALARRLRQPFRILACAVVVLALLDVLLRILMGTVLAPSYARFLEDGQRLYPFAGSLSHDDMARAVAHHRIRRAPAGGTAIVVLGDSGTIGSYLPAEDSLPAAMERRLAARGHVAHAANLAWYARLLPKDVMILEAAWNARMDVVVLTISDDVFDTAAVDRWISSYPHVSFNTPLFSAFMRRVAPDDRPPFERVHARLVAADRQHSGVLRRFLHRSVALFRYRPYLQSLLYLRLMPDGVTSRMRVEVEETRHRRALVATPDPRAPHGIPPERVDRDQVDILASTVRLLRARGAVVILHVEPRAPREWTSPTLPGSVTAEALAADVARETGALVVDLSDALGAADFTDGTAHYTAEGNRRLGEALADAVAARLEAP